MPKRPKRKQQKKKFQASIFFRGIHVAPGGLLVSGRVWPNLHPFKRVLNLHPFRGIKPAFFWLAPTFHNQPGEFRCWTENKWNLMAAGGFPIILYPTLNPGFILGIVFFFTYCPKQSMDGIFWHTFRVNIYIYILQNLSFGLGFPGISLDRWVSLVTGNQASQHRKSIACCPRSFSSCFQTSLLPVTDPAKNSIFYRDVHGT